jgi:CHASE2 domain-containing sensor protein
MLLRQLPDNDEIFARSIDGKPVVLGFGVSNEGVYLPPVKAGIAFTGESPVAAPPRIKAATLLRPELEAGAAGLGPAIVRGSNFPERWRTALSKPRAGGIARCPGGLHLFAAWRP